MTSAPQDRYLHKPFVGSSHSWALAQCAAIGAGRAVLDIGAGSGVIGKLLREQGVTDLTAVEIDPRAREHLASLYPTVVASLEEAGDRRFDLVLLLDVLEHLTDPATFLRAAADRLAPGGTMLISVPNIAHWSVRLPLLFGHFEYTRRGILDETHYSFFTRKRLARMLAAEPDLQVRGFAASVPPVEFVLPRAIWDNGAFRALSKAHVAVAQALPSFFAYQLLANVTRTSRG